MLPFYLFFKNLTGFLSAAILAGIIPPIKDIKILINIKKIIFSNFKNNTDETPVISFKIKFIEIVEI